jgi:hypothetical protein
MRNRGNFERIIEGSRSALVFKDQIYLDSTTEVQQRTAYGFWLVASNIGGIISVVVLFFQYLLEPWNNYCNKLKLITFLTTIKS